MLDFRVKQNQSITQSIPECKNINRNGEEEGN
jgi:hypothetical protein